MLIHRESKTFDRLGQTRGWAATREKRLAKVEPVRRRTRRLANTRLAEILQEYRREVSKLRPIGRSNAGHFRFLEKTQIARMQVSDIETADIIEHIRSRRQSGAGPSTANNDIMWFAIHSAWRQGEITERPFSNNASEHQTGLVRDLKHPTEREQVRCLKYTPEAREIICHQDHDEDRIFPFARLSIGSAFHQACKTLNIQDLHTRNLRHETSSRPFEAGYSIVEGQQFRLHDSCGTLSR